MTNIMIADDHSVVRRGIKQILSEETDLKVAGEASNSEEIFSLLNNEKWDLLILDISMPGKSGLDILLDLKKMKPEMKILILSMHPEKEIALRALKTGADGYLNKDIVPGELIRAIRKVIGGGKYISSNLAETLIFSSGKDISKQPHEDLSEREFQVLCLLASGHSLTQIAEKLTLSVKTISTYRSRILQKMNLKSNVDITHYAIKHKLVLTN